MRDVGEIFYYLIDDDGGREYNTIQEVQAVVQAGEGIRNNKKDTEAIVVKAEVIRKRIRSTTETDLP